MLYKKQIKFSNIITAHEIFKSLGKKPQTIKFSINEKPCIFDGHIMYSVITNDKRK